MSTPPTRTDPNLDDATIADAAFQSVLRTLVEQGAKLVTDLTDDPGPVADKAEPYERFTRAIRRSIALSRHIVDNPAKPPPPQPPAPSPELRRADARRAVLREVETIIETDAKTPERIESLRDELHERLDDPAFDREIATRSPLDLITEIVRDLGLANKYADRYPRRTPADVRDLNARAAAPTTPLPTFDEIVPANRRNPVVERQLARTDDG